MIIHVAKNRFVKTLEKRELTWDEICTKLSKTKHTQEKMNAFKNMSKEKQLEIKDVGGFVAGDLINGKRLNTHVINRSIITLDADYADPGFVDNLSEVFKYEVFLYSTHASTPLNPRYRVLIPLSRFVTPDEYQPIARWIASVIGIDYFDHTTYDPSRLMFFPSTPNDAAYTAKRFNGPFLNPDEVLNNYEDWSDPDSWTTSDENKKHIKGQMQTDPLTKDGLIGAFCKAYPIRDAIEVFLSEVYTPCHSRYTYTKGTSAGGAVVYDEKFLYSNHATDPVSQRCCNAFDLVRIHKFGNDKASLSKMLDFVSKDEKVKKIQSVNLAKNIESKTGTNLEGQSWLNYLSLDKTGVVLDEVNNYILIMNNDPMLKGIGAYNSFARREVLLKDPPWDRHDRGDDWTDFDNSQLFLYFGQTYNLKSKAIIDAVRAGAFQKNYFHPVKDFISAVPWDGKERVERLFIDYLGAEDNEYTRVLTKKTLTAAVARIYEPGCKFDTMLTLVGKQGIGKSMIIKKLASDWFSDTLTNLGNKDAFELLDGVWIMEMSELVALKKSERETIKGFISKQVDQYRQAYATITQKVKRSCIFIGTTNEQMFLNDDTGNRRFWVLNVNGIDNMDKFDELTPEVIHQVWAEAFTYYNQGYDIYKLPTAVATQALDQQKAHLEVDPWTDMIASFLDTPIPVDMWPYVSLESRRNYYDLTEDQRKKQYTCKFELRDQTCPIEIMSECLKLDKKNTKPSDSRRIKAALLNLGWVYIDRIRSPIYGQQRSYSRYAMDF